MTNMATCVCLSDRAELKPAQRYYLWLTAGEGGTDTPQSKMLEETDRACSETDWRCVPLCVRVCVSDSVCAAGEAGGVQKLQNISL